MRRVTDDDSEVKVRIVQWRLWSTRLGDVEKKEGRGELAWLGLA